MAPLVGASGGRGGGALAGVRRGLFCCFRFGKPRLRAVKLKQDGEKATRKVIWELSRNVPMMPSAVFVKPYLFVVSEKGFAMCLEAATGKVKWQERRAAPVPPPLSLPMGTSIFFPRKARPWSFPRTVRLR